MKRCLLTGARGFFGTYIARGLHDDGYEVLAPL
jgi:nucleoside-diphosphate-sugar epimerase